MYPFGPSKNCLPTDMRRYYGVCVSDSFTGLQSWVRVNTVRTKSERKVSSYRQVYENVHIFVRGGDRICTLGSVFLEAWLSSSLASSTEYNVHIIGT